MHNVSQYLDVSMELSSQSYWALNTECGYLWEVRWVLPVETVAAMYFPIGFQRSTKQEFRPLGSSV